MTTHTWSSPPVANDDDLGPVRAPESAGLPLGAAGHIKAQSGDDRTDAPLAVEDGGMVATTEAGPDLIKGDAAVAGGEPADDVSCAGNIELALLREQLSAGHAGHGGDEPEYVSDTQNVRRHLRQGRERLMLSHNWRAPDYGLGFRVRGNQRQHRWRQRIELRRARRKQARLNLGSMPTHLSDGSELTDREGSATGHISAILRKLVSHRQAAVSVVKQLPTGELDAAAIAPVEGQAERGVRAVADRSDGKALPDVTLDDLDSRDCSGEAHDEPPSCE